VLGYDGEPITDQPYSVRGSKSSVCMVRRGRRRRPMMTARALWRAVCDFGLEGSVTSAAHAGMARSPRVADDHEPGLLALPRRGRVGEAELVSSACLRTPTPRPL
jgi:hypothetical protein